jgi:hypothetical protein
MNEKVEPLEVFEKNDKRKKRIYIIVMITSLAVIITATILVSIDFNSDDSNVQPELYPKCDKSDYTEILNLTNRIVNGQTVIPHSFPWMVTLNGIFGFMCGGSIIADQWVLTAGHCEGAFTVETGQHLAKDIAPESNIYRVDYFIRPKDYKKTAKFILNDIALIKLKRKIEFNQNVSYINISQSDPDLFTEKCLVTAGWGNTDGIIQSRYRDLKQTFLIAINSIKKCIISHFWDEKKTFCTISESDDPYSIPCFGDSGKY